MDRIHALRYKVYCKEKGFLDAKRYPDGKEYDSFDRYSVHFAAYDREGEIAGTVRLVIPPAGRPFPYEGFCTPILTHVQPPRGRVAEISRLIIAPEFRVRPDQGAFGFASTLTRLVGRFRKEEQQQDFTYTQVEPVADQNTSPRILFGLFRKMYRYSIDHNVTHWYAAMEATLARMLKRYHMVFQKVSPTVEYYGPVALYFASIAELEAGLQAGNPELLRWMRKTRSSEPAKQVVG